MVKKVFNSKFICQGYLKLVFGYFIGEKLIECPLFFATVFMMSEDLTFKNAKLIRDYIA